MAIQIEDLSPAAGATKRTKRVGRGFGSGHGKTATRGYNGQGQRSGEAKKVGFEGGQMPLFRRTAKKHHFGRPTRYLLRWAEVSVGALSAAFSGTEPIDEAKMAAAGVVPSEKKAAADGQLQTSLSRRFDGVRVLGTGVVDKSLEVHAHYFTAAAKEKIEAAGGRSVVTGAPQPRPS